MKEVAAFIVPPWVSRSVARALLGGSKLHGFRSGGGLRVLSMEGPFKGYGEHPHIADAMRILAEDLDAGGRAYADVYGPVHAHYLTGASEPADLLDARMLRGDTIDAAGRDDGITVEIRGYREHETPEDVVRAARSGIVTRWTDTRGVTFEARPCTFPNGEAGCSVKLVEVPVGMLRHRALMWRTVQRGHAGSLIDAIAAALVAMPREETQPLEERRP